MSTDHKYGMDIFSLIGKPHHCILTSCTVFHTYISPGHSGPGILTAAGCIWQPMFMWEALTCVIMVSWTTSGIYASHCFISWQFTAASLHRFCDFRRLFKKAFGHFWIRSIRFVFRVKNGWFLPLVVSSPPNAIVMHSGGGGAWLGYLNLKWIWCHV